MGTAIARHARSAGAAVTLVHGPISAPLPMGTTPVAVESAEEMHTAMLQHAADADVIVMSAAVADYRPKAASSEKLKKDKDELSFAMVRNPDILADLSQKFPNALMIGFAAETSDLRENALDKLQRKNLDIIVANSIARGNSVAGVDSTSGLIINRHGRERGVGTTSKEQMAVFLLEEIRSLLESGRE
jgi:phosphopantothenoylcysteine decarboxylase/phosphopantothenate--cysteine ligase